MKILLILFFISISTLMVGGVPPPKIEISLGHLYTAESILNGESQINDLIFSDQFDGKIWESQKYIIRARPSFNVRQLNRNWVNQFLRTPAEAKAFIRVNKKKYNLHLSFLKIDSDSMYWELDMLKELEFIQKIKSSNGVLILNIQIAYITTISAEFKLLTEWD